MAVGRTVGNADGSVSHPSKRPVICDDAAADALIVVVGPVSHQDDRVDAVVEPLELWAACQSGGLSRALGAGVVEVVRASTGTVMTSRPFDRVTR